MAQLSSRPRMSLTPHVLSHPSVLLATPFQSSSTTPNSTSGEADISFEGEASKRGETFQSWKSRYFVLRGLVLTYYTEKHGVLKGAIDIQRDSVIAECEEECTKKEFAFSIATPHRTFVLRVPSVEARSQWMQVLELAKVIVSFPFSFSLCIPLFVCLVATFCPHEIPHFSRIFDDFVPFLALAEATNRG